MNIDHVIACITARDEEKTIGQLVRRLRALGLGTVIVVDDGSTDRTFYTAREAGAWAIPHLKGQGIGPSLLEAWRNALEWAECQAVVQLDAGGSHAASEVLEMVARIEAGADVAIGSRFVRVQGSHRRGFYLGAHRWRRVMSRLASAACNLAQPGAHWSDWTSGYRAMSRRAVEMLLGQTYTARGHAWQIEVLGHAGELGLKIAEHPIVYMAGRSSLSWWSVVEALGVWGQLANNYGRVRS